jgi:glycosyltransferase involved in cell wall biosynthesis
VHIAVVIPAFNAADFLHSAIQSVLDQTHVDWSLVVVDDGSTDDTASIVGQFPDARVRLLRQQNAGVSVARNSGVRAALTGGNDPPGDNPEQSARSFASTSFGGPTRLSTICGAGVGKTIDGPFKRGHEVASHRFRRVLPDAFLFLDGDDWLAPAALDVLARTLDDALWAVAAVGRYARVGLNADARLSRSPAHGSLLERLLTRNLFANGGHLLIRREAIEAAGEFRTDLAYGEDWEYWTRLAVQGEFVPVQSRSPLLFVRERLAGAYLSRATDPSAYRPVLDAIYSNPGLAERVGKARLAALARQAEAEMAWTVGRELIKHGRQPEGLGWLGRSFREAPSLNRLMLLGLSRLRLGPFRPYPTVA